MKKLLNPAVQIIVGIVFFGLAFLDYELHGPDPFYDTPWNHMSWFGRTSVIMFLVVFAVGASRILVNKIGKK